MRKLKQLFSDPFGTKALSMEIDELKNKMKAQEQRIYIKLKELDKLTREDIDIGFRGQCTVVLTGVYKGKGFVRFYDTDTKEFEDIVRMFGEYKRKSLLRNVDAPYAFSGSFKL